MNRFKKISLFSLLCALCMMLFTFAACSSEQLVFTYSESTDSYEVKAASTDISGDIVIPATYKDLPVQIAHNAFRNCQQISSISLSEGIKYIGALSFSKCSATIINIPVSVESFSNSAAFSVNEYKSLTINYAGTKEQWYAIKGAVPSKSYYGVKLVCSDGVAFDTTEA